MQNIRRFTISLCCMMLVIFLYNKKVFAEPTIIRLGGIDRYETSIKISQNSWQNSDYAVLASGENYPDALCAAPLAEKYNAPILLSAKNLLSDGVVQELKRLGVKNVFIVGGTGALSQNIESQLVALDISFIRLQGQDRFETSVKVAEQIGTSNGVVITSGENFPDALSIAPIAGNKQMPILLTTSKLLPQSIRNFINSNTISSCYVVGGSGVINDSSLSNIGSYKRLAGSNRYETNKAVINEFLGVVNISNVYLATGEDFPDALSGSAAAARSNSIIALTDNITCSTQPIIQTNIANISAINVLGGTSRVSDGLIEKLLYGKDKVVLGYSTYYFNGDTSSYNSLTKNSGLINEIATDTFYVDSSGNISGNIPYDQISFANNNHIDAYAMLSNNFDGNITRGVLESSSNRKNLINNVLNALKTYNYKGVNVDFEGVYYYDRDYLTTFMSELYTTLHSQGYNVSMALQAKTRDSINDKWTWAYNYSALANYCDQAVIMTYDEHWFGGDPGPIASIGWVKSVVAYTITAIPKDKILLGIAGYGYDWASSGSKAYGEGQAYAVAAQHGASVSWDTTSESPYYSYIDNSGVSHTVWFENGTSISYKLDIVNSYDLKGVALWRLGLESDDYWTTINSKFGL